MEPSQDNQDGAVPSALATLSPESIGAIADALASRLAHLQTRPRHLLDARQVAQLLGVSREWVYDHQYELGVQRLASDDDARRPRLRFDAERVQAWLARGDRRPSEVEPAPPGARRRLTSSTTPLLPIRGA